MLQQGRVLVDSDWNEEQETDLGITLLDLWAFLTDILIYYQDRIAEEAFLETASRRRRVSKTDLQSILLAAKAVNAITSRITSRQLKRAHDVPPHTRAESINLKIQVVDDNGNPVGKPAFIYGLKTRKSDRKRAKYKKRKKKRQD